jgi:anti-sigma regulatory factor (Ser/Thr protein kinase)
VAPPIIPLPAQFRGLTLSKLAGQVVAHARNGWPPELIFDFGNLDFIRPAGIVFLSNLIHWLHEKNTTVKFLNVTRTSQALLYLDDSLFFEQHCGAKVRASASPRGTTRPLKRIAHRDSHAWLGSDLVPWLASRLGITEASLYPFKACASELFNNIQDHTRYDIGSIFVQHFPRENGINICVSDFGLGIPNKVREKVAGITDSAAILKAVEEGFTTKSQPGNQGTGLDYLLKTVVRGNGGQVTIYSCESIVRFDRRGTIIKPYMFSNVGFSPGTTIEINLRTDTIEVLPEESEDLQW